MGPADRFNAFRALADRRGRPGGRLIESPAGSGAGTAESPEDWAPAVAVDRGLPAAAALGPARYDADLAAPHSRRHVRVCRVCEATACFASRAGTRAVDAHDQRRFHFLRTLLSGRRETPCLPSHRAGTVTSCGPARRLGTCRRLARPWFAAMVESYGREEQSRRTPAPPVARRPAETGAARSRRRSPARPVCRGVRDATGGPSSSFETREG